MKKINMLVLGIIIMLLGTGIGTYIINKSSSDESAKTIQDLKDTLSLKNEELKQKQISLEKKQDENNILSAKILEFQVKLDFNTSAIGKVTDAISQVAKNTNQISNIIKNEQREKGKVEFNSNDYEFYHVDLGMIGGLMKRSNLNNEETFNINETPFSMLIKNGKFLVSLKIKDKNENLIFEVNKGEWAINKNQIFSVNYDLSGIEVIDKTGNIILQIELIKNRFEVIGIFYEKNGVTLIHPGLLANVLYSDANYNNRLKEFYSNVKRKFVHYGEDYLGKRLPIE